MLPAIEMPVGFSTGHCDAAHGTLRGFARRRCGYKLRLAGTRVRAMAYMHVRMQVRMPGPHAWRHAEAASGPARATCAGRRAPVHRGFLPQRPLPQHHFRHIAGAEQS